MTSAVVAGLLAAVVVAVWPGPSARDRLPRRRRDLGAFRAVVASMLAVRPRRVVPVFACVVAVAGLLVGGPVAAVVLAVYAGLAGREWVRRAERKLAVAGRTAALDGLCALIADLRAGVPPVVVAGGLHLFGNAGSQGGSDVVRGAGSPGGDRIGGLVAAVWRLAEQTGAPAADLLDRIESDARAADRSAAAAAAQAAGAQATALLLAALPLGGIALGYAIGADPLRVLLHTPLGAGCAVVAVALQCGGLRWAQWLTDGPGR